MKKKTLLVASCIAGTFPLFAQTSTALSKSAELNFRAMDIPLLDGMAYFINMTGTFFHIVTTLAMLIFLITILWNAFRLWIGTQTVRKACVDIIVKSLLFTAVFVTYSAIRIGVIDTAMKIGSRAGGGADLLSIQFSNLTDHLEEKITVSTSAIKKLIENGAREGAKLNKTDVDKLAKKAGMTDEQMDKFVKEHGYEVTQNQSAAQAFKKGLIFGGTGATICAIVAGVKNVTNYNKMYSNMSKAEKDAINQDIANGEVANAQRLISAMAEVLVENPAWQEEVKKGGSPSIKTSVSKYLYSPFISVDPKDANAQKIKNKAWAKTGVKESVLVSPGQMIKTGVLIANILKIYGTSEYDNNIGIVKKKQIFPTWNEVFDFILLTVLTICLVCSCIFCVIQYIMCIFEYFITTSLGVIFIPFILWDGTKSFAAKLVTLFSAYFIKIVVMLICLFWTYAAYINMGMMVLSSSEPLSLLNFAYCLFVIILGYVCTQNAPQIAVTMLNGSPQLSMGEFLHAAGTIAAKAALAGKAASAVARPAAVGAVTGGMAGAAAARGAWQGVSGAGGTTGQKISAALKSGTGAMFKQWGADSINSVSRLIAGRDIAANSKDSNIYGRGHDPNHSRSDAKTGFADIQKSYHDKYAKNQADATQTQQAAAQGNKNTPKKVNETEKKRSD